MVNFESVKNLKYRSRAKVPGALVWLLPNSLLSKRRRFLGQLARGLALASPLGAVGARSALPDPARFKTAKSSRQSSDDVLKRDWPTWRARTVVLPGSDKTIDIFGIVHHQPYVADQLSAFIKSRSPNAVLIEQSPESLHDKISVYKEVLRTRQIPLEQLYQCASYPGMGRQAKKRFAAGFAALAAEIFKAFEAMEAIGLDIETSTIAGDMPRQRLKDLMANPVAHAAEEAWLELNDKHNCNVQEAYVFAEKSLADLQRNPFPNKPSTDAALANCVARYNEFFEIPDQVLYEGRWPRGPIMSEREQHMVGQAVESAASHIVMVVGSDHVDGIDYALRDLGFVEPPSALSLQTL